MFIGYRIYSAFHVSSCSCCVRISLGIEFLFHKVETYFCISKCFAQSNIFSWIVSCQESFDTAIFHIWHFDNCSLFNKYYLALSVWKKVPFLIYNRLPLFICFTDWLSISMQWHDYWPSVNWAIVLLMNWIQIVYGLVLSFCQFILSRQTMAHMAQMALIYTPLLLSVRHVHQSFEVFKLESELSLESLSVESESILESFMMSTNLKTVHVFKNIYNKPT